LILKKGEHVINGGFIPVQVAQLVLNDLLRRIQVGKIFGVSSAVVTFGFVLAEALIAFSSSSFDRNLRFFPVSSKTQISSGGGTNSGCSAVIMENRIERIQERDGDKRKVVMGREIASVMNQYAGVT
jgi:Flp pilus assembly protein TadB